MGEEEREGIWRMKEIKRMENPNNRKTTFWV